MLKKILDILRRLFSRGGEAFVDKNIVALMEQQINDSRQAIRNSEAKLVDITASRNLVEKEKGELEKELSELGNNLSTLLARPEAERDQSLAQRLAVKFKEKEDRLNALKADLATKEATIAKTKDAIKTSKAKLAEFENRKDSVESNQALIEATASISNSTSGVNSALSELEESVRRTEEKQTHQLARFEAADALEAENSGDSLNDDLVKAGLKKGGSSVDDILSRFQPKTEA